METLQTIGICVGASALVLIAFFLFLIAGDLSMFRLSMVSMADMIDDENEYDDDEVPDREPTSRRAKSAPRRRR